MATEYFNDAWRIPNNKNQSLVSNYSMQFDGSNDNITLDNTNDFLNVDYLTISIWFKPVIAENAALIGNRYFNSGYMSWTIQLFSNGKVRYLQRSPNLGTSFYTIDTYNVGEWNHISVTYDSVNGAKMYLNGGSPVVNTNQTTPIQYNTDFVSDNVTIGSAPAGGSTSSPTGPTQHFNGSIDQVSIFDYGLSATQVSTLYGGGTAVTNPMSLSPKPIAYYQLGDQSVDNGANYLVPNNSLNGSEGYSPYALDFDGSNDVLNCGNDSSLQITGAMTVSYWFKGQGGSASIGGVGKLGGGGNRGFCLGMNSNGTIIFYIAPTANSLTSTSYSSHTPDTNWHHVVGVFTPSTSLEIYFDGDRVKNPSTSTSSQYNASNNLQIGARGDSAGFFDGEMSNAAIWNTNLSTTEITEIYNQGVPSNLNTFSGTAPVSWWQLGSNSSFNTNWTCLDEIGTNNAVSAGSMTEDAITNGVGYSASGLGTSSIDIKGDAPYSTANGLSENMDVLDRVTDVPS